ncbi:MAG: glycosyltransferase family 2 protein [Bacteroidales bacterium]|nr:glycosyltransferase family 2 protein [Bacteroidales bacterium]
MEAADITVIIPVYNRTELLGRTLRSIEAQTVKPRRVVIVDNASTDSSLSVAQDWAMEMERKGMDVKVVECRKPGAACARNEGLRHVESQWVMHFDSDDTMRPGHIERVAHGIAAHPDAALLWWDINVVGGRFSRQKHMSGRSDIERHLLHGSLASQRYAARRELLPPGVWDEDLRQWDDYVSGLRVLSKNPNTVFLPGPDTVDVYPQEESITGLRYIDRRGWWEKALDRCIEVLASTAMTEKERRRAMRLVELRRAVVFGMYHKEGSPLGKEDLSKRLDGIDDRGLRRAMRIVFRYTSTGLPGAGHLSWLLV